MTHTYAYTVVKEVTLPPGDYLSSADIIKHKDLLLAPNDAPELVPEEYVGDRAGNWSCYNYRFYRPSISFTIT
jgi:hypothetical protein